MVRYDEHQRCKILQLGLFDNVEDFPILHIVDITRFQIKGCTLLNAAPDFRYLDRMPVTTVHVAPQVPVNLARIGARRYQVI
ncbi:hypothetical protein ASF04_06000 [Duganella sp. Leaf61]|nr:hypothetical protein ASF04_06000 [Duganella sp. Leaf61]